jgi:hypothetical protein
MGADPRVKYCIGTGARDSKRRLGQASGFDEFVNQILALPRATTKEGRRYICGAMRRNGTAALHRCKADVLPRWWLGADLDGGSREEVDILLMRLPEYGVHLRPVQGHRPELQQFHLFRDAEYLDEEPLDLLQEPLAERAQRIVIVVCIGRDIAKRQQVVKLPARCAGSNRSPWHSRR